MSSDLLALLLEGKIDITDFSQWISGEKVKNIDSRISRSEFSLYILNFIQQQTSSLIALSNSCMQQDSKLRNEPTTIINKVSLMSSENNHIEQFQRNDREVANLLQSNGVHDQHFSSSLENEKYHMQRKTNTVSSVNVSPQINNCGQKSLSPYSTPDSPMFCYSLYETTPCTNQYIGQSPQIPSNVQHLQNPNPNVSNYLQSPHHSSFNNTHKKKHNPSSRPNPNLGHFIPNVNQKTPTTVNSQQKHSSDKNLRVVRSHLFSESSESSVEGYKLSPKSPLYDQNFPDLSSKPVNYRHGQNSNLNSSNSVTPSATSLIKPTLPINSPHSSVSTKSPHKSKPFKRLSQTQNGKKRVNPTRIQFLTEELDNKDKKEKSQSFGTAVRIMPSESSPFQQSVTVEPRTNYDEERMILKQKRSEPVTSHSNNPQLVILPNAPILNMISPDPSKVTCYDYIVCLANIYCILLDYNFVPNITAEIHFIFSLLTIQFKSKFPDNNCKKIGKEAEKQFLQERNESLKQSIVPLEKKQDDNINSPNTVPENIKLKPSHIETSRSDSISYKNILDNIHNCVMFAVVVIEKQIHVIKQLDRVTLKLLADNERLKLYSSSFASELNQLYQTKDVMTKNTVIHGDVQITDATVKFQLDTDNRDNFINMSSFSKFRKQRDAFYELLHSWRTKRCEPKHDRILQLLSLSNDPINMTHLARLVCCQLISDAMNKTNQNQDTLDGSLLPGVTKDKLSLLEARLKNPQGRDQGSPRPPTQFPKEQHFYKIFMEVASEHSCFRDHFMDCLIMKILELDNTSLEFDESDSRREEISQELRQRIVLSSLLAKFLGLVVFSTYRGHSDLPENILETEISIRKKVHPPIDVVVCLQKSIKQRTLIKTVPWIVEYLGMIDCVSPFLPCYRSALQILIEIYRSVSPYYFSNKNSSRNEEIKDKTIIYSEDRVNIDVKEAKLENNHHISCYSALLLRLSLGWMFDSSFFPETLFFSLARTSEDIFQLQNDEGTKFSLDSLDLIDEKFIFESCPYFLQIKLLLIANASVKGGSVRHITPVSAQIGLPSKTVRSTVLELQLEDNFLSGQVASLRSTLDFVKERVASACIKYICSHVIAKAKEEGIKKINKSLNDKEKRESIGHCVTDLKVEIDSTISGFCEPRIKSSLEALLGPELLEPKIISVALKIASRRCKEKIVDWLNSHINLTDIFTKLTLHSSTSGIDGNSVTIKSETEVVKDKEGFSRVNADEKKASTYQFDSANLPIDTIICLRDLICDITEGEIPYLNELNVIEILQRIRNVVSEPSLLLITLSIDFISILVAYKPDIICQSVMSEFGNFWNSVELNLHGTENPFQRLICPRNILLFCQHNPTAAWAALSKFIVFVLSNKFLTLNQLEVQCVAIFRHTWPPGVLKLISSCLKSTLERIKQENICQNNPKVMLMLELVSETNRDLEDGL